MWIALVDHGILYGTSGNFFFVEHFVPKILVSYKNEKHYNHMNLVFDQAPCHTSHRSKVAFNGASVNVTWVPKRMTYIAQPADQSWMAPFKSLYFKKWNHWLVHAPKAIIKKYNYFCIYFISFFWFFFNLVFYFSLCPPSGLLN